MVFVELNWFYNSKNKCTTHVSFIVKCGNVAVHINVTHIATLRAEQL